MKTKILTVAVLFAGLGAMTVPLFAHHGAASFELGAPVVFMGFGLADDNLHAPNEKMHMPNFYRGIETVITFFEELA